MKICHVTKKYPDALGGDATVVSALQKQQAKAGHEITIFTSKCKAIRNGPHIYKVGLSDTPASLDHITIRRIVSLVMMVFRAFGIFWKERPEVIHTHSIDMAFAVSFAARFFHIPRVHTFHIVTFYDESQSALRRAVELRLAKWARLHTITAPNRADVAALQEAGFDQATLVPNGIDLHFWHAHMPREAKKADKKAIFTFISVGRLESQKGYEYLVKAAALLKQTAGQQFRVLIVGEGSQKAALQRLIRDQNVEKTVTLMGRKTAARTRALLAASDVAVFASLYETTPLTLLEAWAIGLPVIITPVGLLRGAVTDDRVFLAAIRDEQSLMQVMRQSMSDRTKRKAVANAGRAAVEQYAWPGIARTTESLYRSLV